MNECWNCGEPGHFAATCPFPPPEPRAETADRPPVVPPRIYRAPEIAKQGAAACRQLCGWDEKGRARKDITP